MFRKTTTKQQIRQYNVDATMHILVENMLKPGSAAEFYTTIGKEEETILLFALGHTFPWAKARINECKKLGLTTTNSRQGKDRRNGNGEPRKQQITSRVTSIKNTLLTFAIILISAFLVFLGYIWLKQEGML